MADNVDIKVSNLINDSVVRMSNGEYVKVNWKKDSKNRRQDILIKLEQASKYSISVPSLADEFGVSRQYIYDILKEFPTYKDKLKRKDRVTKSTTISSRVLSFIDNFNGKPTVREIAEGVGTTSNYVFTVLNKHKEYKSKIIIEKREPRETTNEEVIAFINEQKSPITIANIAKHFNEKYNVIHGVISRNTDKILSKNIDYKK